MATDKTYRAITEVHITETPGKPGDKAKGIAPTPPKVVIIPAKGLVDMDPDSDTCQELLGNRAIELDTSSEKAAPQKISKKKASTEKPAIKDAAKKPPVKKMTQDSGDGGLV